jgi:hypothetical protein
MHSNPFATRFTRPGALPYLFGTQESVEQLVARLEEASWWGQIIGPHGTGKSTLLHSLAPAIEARGRSLVWFSQSQGERRLNVSQLEAEKWTAQTQIIIDGYEQLGWLARRWVKRLCRVRGAGLLVTAHEDVGLPKLWESAASEALVQQIVQQLLVQGEHSLIRPEDVSRCYQAHAGNVRETLFGLYDLHERRQAGG